MQFWSVKYTGMPPIINNAFKWIYEYFFSSNLIYCNINAISQISRFTPLSENNNARKSTNKDAMLIPNKIRKSDTT